MSSLKCSMLFNDGCTNGDAAASIHLNWLSNLMALKKDTFSNILKKKLQGGVHLQVQKRGISLCGDGLGDGVAIMAAFLLRAASSRDLILFSFPDRNSVFLSRAMILASVQTWVVKDFLLAAKSIDVMIAFRPCKAHSIFCLKLWSESSGNGFPWNPCSEPWSG